jgi:hypothetical protein
MIAVFLVPVGRGRYELYSETPEDLDAAPRPGEARVRRWAHAARLRWHELVDAARRGSGTGRLARWRDAFVCRLAESITEQRTLWSLRDKTEAQLFIPSTLDAPQARGLLNASLAGARRHHGRWLVVDLVLFAASAVFALVPGPNLIAYYLLFRLVGHLQSWRGAGRALNRIAWHLQPDASLAELAGLSEVPREARAIRLEAIAARLNLRRLSAFFDRVAVGSH